MMAVAAADVYSVVAIEAK